MVFVCLQHHAIPVKLEIGSPVPTRWPSESSICEDRRLVADSTYYKSTLNFEVATTVAIVATVDRGRLLGRLVVRKWVCVYYDPGMRPAIAESYWALPCFTYVLTAG
eukprot:5622824-Pyramimonas_sp.AAC.3